MFSSVRKILEKRIIEASAPSRIDSGGTWDIKAMSLPFERIQPTTVNMALNLRTWVTLSPYKDGWIKITSQGFSQSEKFQINDLSFTTPFGIFFAAINYFGIHGLEVDIRSDIPVKSSLGGSSTALVALIKALSKLNAVIGRAGLTDNEILHLGYNLEDGISMGGCGSQDQAAAVYGGVHRWIWKYGNMDTFMKREPLLDNSRIKELSMRILVAYSGRSHISLETNRGYIHDFLSGRTRSGWLKANEVVSSFSDAIRNMDWKRAIGCLKEEMCIRREITPECLIPVTHELINIAEEEECAARFAGAGAGGCVWALGEPDHIGRLKTVWNNLLSKNAEARILDCEIDPNGVR